jgi:hypothetical protein
VSRFVTEGEKAPEYYRKTKSLDRRIRTFKAVFGRFKKLRLTDTNPFEKVEAHELPRTDPREGC